ncbi:MAG: tRNA dihydrouridine synthase DusB [Bacillota bacterium]
MMIDNLKIENPVLVAPMAGVTDYPYRKILREMGAELLYTEMVSAKGLVYGNQNTKDLIKLDKKDYSAVQIFGGEAEIIAKAAKIVEENYEVDLIDINLGCPAPKIVKNNYGSALMKNPDLTKKIVKEVSKAVNVPVTVKMRKGWNEEKINAVKIAKIAEENGAKAVAVHGRTRSEFYSGEADWEIIKKVKKGLNIPVIGNGDVFSTKEAKKMLEKTDCDAVMLARGIQGNPWLVKNCILALNNQELIEILAEDKIKMAIRHLQMAIDFYGKKRAIPLMRKHISWYLKGLSHSSEIKDKVNKSKNKDEVKEILNDYLIFLQNF